MLVQISRECTPPSPYLSTGISNLLQPAQAEVVLGQPSTYLASWVRTALVYYCTVYIAVYIQGPYTVYNGAGVGSTVAVLDTYTAGRLIATTPRFS
jgi:hypothetical protein